MRPVRHLFAATALALATPTAGSAVPAQAPAPAAAPSDTVTMNMRDADIRTLIQWIADQTGKNMVVHKDVQGKVTVLSSKPVTRAEAYRVFLSVLQVHGFAAIETPEAVKIVPSSLAAQSGVPVSSGAASSTDDMVVQTFKLSNISATEVAQTLRPLVSKDAVINADASTNMLLVADHAATVNELQSLVQRMDRSGGAEVELVRLENANAKEIVASLSSLFPSGGGRGEGAPGQSGALPLAIAADERSNSVLLSGDAAKRAQARRLIRQMDKPLVGEGNTQVFYLQYATAKEVAPILKSIAQSVLKDQKDKAASFSIEPSESANALVINAPPGLIANLREVVDKLDIQRAQVLVEALVVEVSGDVSDDLGITWATADIGDESRSGGFGVVNTLGNVALDTSGASTVLGMTPVKGLSFGYMKDGDIRAVIHALSATTKANILSTPTVVAIDNEPASLLVGQNVPFITGQATSAASGTANPFTTIERKDIGISLEITPRINQGDAITLDIKQKVENIAPSVENASDLITNKREINTKALIKDDTVLVLGGLISDNETTSREKVPILGDLPLIGRLFSSTGHDRTKQNLMVFIHPVILKDQAHIAEVSRARYKFMQNEQRQARQDEATTTRRTPQSAELEDFDTFSRPNRAVNPAPETGKP